MKKYNNDIYLMYEEEVNKNKKANDVMEIIIILYAIILIYGRTYDKIIWRC